MGSRYYYYGSRKSLNISINYPIDLTENRRVIVIVISWSLSLSLASITYYFVNFVNLWPNFFGIVMRQPMSVLQFENLQKVLT